MHLCMHFQGVLIMQFSLGKTARSHHLLRLWLKFLLISPSFFFSEYQCKLADGTERTATIPTEYLDVIVDVDNILGRSWRRRHHRLPADRRVSAWTDPWITTREILKSGRQCSHDDGITRMARGRMYSNRNICMIVTWCLWTVEGVTQESPVELEVEVMSHGIGGSMSYFTGTEEQVL